MQKKRREKTIDWQLDIFLTNYIISFIPFHKRSAVFQCCKFFNQACFEDYWSCSFEIEDYLEYILLQDYKVTRKFVEVFKSGNLNEIKLLLRFEQYESKCKILDSCNLVHVPSENLLEVLKWTVRQIGINDGLFEIIAIECCLDGADQVFELLLSEGLCESYWFNSYSGPASNKNTLLYSAVDGGNICIVKNLLDHQAFPPKNLSIALEHMLSKSKYEKAGKRFNWPALNNENINELAVVKLLIAKGADINYRNPYSDPLLLSAFKKGNLEIINYLLELGADPTEKDGRNNDILTMAIYSLSVEVVKIALQFDFNLAVNGVDYLIESLYKYRETILWTNSDHFSKSDQVLKIFEQLLSVGARVDGKDKNTIELLILTCKYNMLEVIKLFAAYGAHYCWFIDEKLDQYSYYPNLAPIYAAMETRNLELIKYFVEDLRVSVDGVNEHWMSPVLYAAYEMKSRELTKFLLEAGATVKSSDLKTIKENFQL